uniref:Prominin n=1 Tax=Ascaris lumbricoides TaxID=6252 RepID=A0A9J2PCI2_ASCLU
MLHIWMLPLAAALNFPPFENAGNHYKCNTFLDEEINDHIMTYFYSLVNRLIRLLSRPFPHEKLLSERLLQGEFGDLKSSFINKPHEWIAYEQWWLLLASSLMLFGALFTSFYVIYWCCTYCCYSQPIEKTTDSRHDSCRRHLLNSLISVVVIANIFAVASLLISSQYAEYGASELPHRVGNCVDDLSIYKRDTDMRVRRLLIDDFQLLNASVVDIMSNAGSWLLNRVKQMSGAQAIDQLGYAYETSRQMQERITDLQSQVASLNNELIRFHIDFVKLRRASSRDLNECINGDDEVTKSFCRKAEKILNDFDDLPLTIHQNIIPNNINEELERVTHSNISEIVVVFNSGLIEIEKELQAEIDHSQYRVQSKLKQIGDDLFMVAETISTEIRQINFDRLQAIFATYVSGNNEYPQYVQYSWSASLVLSGIYALIALYFLFALCYGICGRRPTYYRDDCCVRSTGSRFGTWLAVLFLGPLSIITAALLFCGANVSSLICQPLQDPFSRPDMLSFAERLFDVWKSNRLRNDLSSYADGHSAVEIIRACSSNNETLYNIFELDKKYHLFNVNEYERDAYMQLNDFIEHLAATIHIGHPQPVLPKEKLSTLESLANFSVTLIDDRTVEKVSKDVEVLDLMSRASPIVADGGRANVNPRAVEAVLERLRVIEASSARPLRSLFRDVLSNVTAINEQLVNLSMPVSGLFARLQHAHTLLSSHMSVYLDEAASELRAHLKDAITAYNEHIRHSMATEVTSCAPLAEIARGSRDALCSHLVDPFNGVWASMLISMLCTVSTVMMGRWAMRFYRTIHPYPKHLSYESTDDNLRVHAFTTDTYDARNRQ